MLFKKKNNRFEEILQEIRNSHFRRDDEVIYYENEGRLTAVVYEQDGKTIDIDMDTLSDWVYPKNKVLTGTERMSFIGDVMEWAEKQGYQLKFSHSGEEGINYKIKRRRS